MSQKSTNQPEYGTELKLAAVRRVLAGESARAVAQELGIRRKRLYVWKDRYAELGAAGLVHRRGGRPRKEGSAVENGSEARGRTGRVAGGPQADRRARTQSGAAGTGTGFFRRSLGFAVHGCPVGLDLHPSTALSTGSYENRVGGAANTVEQNSRSFASLRMTRQRGLRAWPKSFA